MATRVGKIASSLMDWDDKDFAVVESDFFSNGVGNNNGDNTDLKVSQRGAGANMSVDIATGIAYVKITKSGRIFRVRFENLATANVAIGSNGGGTNRVDAVIIKLDQVTEPNAQANNIGSLVVVAGSGASALSDNAIQTAIGSNYTFYRLADVTVAPAASSITNGVIADIRSTVAIGRDDGGYKNYFKGSGLYLQDVVHSPIDATLLPDTDITRDIGSAIKRIRNLYAQYFYGDGSNLTGVNVSALNIVKVAGENISIRNALALLPITESYATGTDERTIAFDSSSVRVSMGFQIPVTQKITQISVNIKRVGTPGDNLRVAIYSDSGGSPNASLGYVDLDKNNIGTSYADVPVIFDTPIALTADTQYHIVLTRPDAGSNSSNYYMWQGNSAGGYSYGVTKTYNGSAWSTDGSRDCRFAVYYTGVKKADDATLSLTRVIGFAVAAFNARIAGQIQIKGEMGGFTLPKYATGGDTNLLNINATDSNYRNDWSSGAKTYEQYFTLGDIGLINSIELHLTKNGTGNDLTATLYKRDEAGTYQSIGTFAITGSAVTNGQWNKYYFTPPIETNGGGAFKLVLTGTGGASNYLGWNGRSSSDAYVFLDQSGTTWSIKDHGLKVNGIQRQYMIGAPVFLDAAGAINFKPVHAYSSIVARVVNHDTIEINPPVPNKLLAKVTNVAAQFASNITQGQWTVPVGTRKIVIQFDWYGYSGGTSGNIANEVILEKPGAYNFNLYHGNSGTNGVGPGVADWTDDVLTFQVVGNPQSSTNIFYFG